LITRERIAGQVDRVILKIAGSMRPPEGRTTEAITFEGQTIYTPFDDLGD
jgi:hypothetical protein